MIVHRRDLRETLANLATLLQKQPAPVRAVIEAPAPEEQQPAGA